MSESKSGLVNNLLYCVDNDWEHYDQYIMINHDVIRASLTQSEKKNMLNLPCQNSNCENVQYIALCDSILCLQFSQYLSHILTVEINELHLYFGHVSNNKREWTTMEINYTDFDSQIMFVIYKNVLNVDTVILMGHGLFLFYTNRAFTKTYFGGKRNFVYYKKTNWVPQL